MKKFCAIIMTVLLLTSTVWAEDFDTSIIENEIAGIVLEEDSQIGDYYYSINHFSIPNGSGNPVASPSNNDNFISIYPDYSMGQMYSISYWYCKKCNYTWDRSNSWFGDLITDCELFE